MLPVSKIENIFKSEEEWEALLEQIAPERAKGYLETQKRIEQMEESLKTELFKRIKEIK